MYMIGVWIISIIATLYLVEQKKFGVGGFLALSIFTGPLAVIIALLLPAKNVPSIDGIQGVNNLQDAKRHLQDIKYSLYALEEKTKNLEQLIVRLSGISEEIQAVSEKRVELVVEPVVRLESGPTQVTSTPVKRADMELDFGRNWLNKIGIVVLALGVAFLISYSFKYIGPFLKIAFGYVVGGALFFAGLKLEAKEKFLNYGRVLLGGAWAIIYFTTYAMYHFEASRIIVNQGADIFLLALVVAGMMTHVMRYKSEGMMSVVLCVAYLTLTIGQITSLTSISLLFLAILALYLVYKFQWVRILSLGIILTYAIHYIWLMPNLLSSLSGVAPFGIAPVNYYDFMNFAFLSCYWGVFLIGVHLVRAIDEPIQARALAATNFGNIALYSVLSYPLILKLFDAQRYVMVLIAGLIYLGCAFFMKRLGREKMYSSDIVAAVFAITFSISLKFLPTTTLLMWMIEIPFLLFIGVNFKERIYRFFSYILSAIVALRVLFSGLGYMPDVHFLGLVWTWYGFMCFWASLSMAVCFYLTQRMKKEPQANGFEALFDHFFSFVASLYLSFCIWSFVKQPWVAFSLSMQGLVFLGVSFVPGLKRFRAYACLAMITSAMIFMFETIAVANPVTKWFIVGCDVLSVFAFYYVMRSIAGQKLSELFFEYEAEMSFVGGLFLLVVAIQQYVPPHWISLSLGLASVVVILAGFFAGNKTERMGGMVLLALTLGRVVLVDLSGLDIIFKIVTLIVLGVLFLGVSYVYTRFGIEKK